MNIYATITNTLRKCVATRGNALVASSKGKIINQTNFLVTLGIIFDF